MIEVNQHLLFAYGAFWILIFLFVCNLLREQISIKRLFNEYRVDGDESES